MPISGVTDEVEDRGYKSGNYFRDRGYKKLTGVGITQKEALDNLGKKCKYNGLWSPRKHPTKNYYHCGFYTSTDRKGQKYKEYHPVFFKKQAETHMAYTYYWPM